MAPEVRQAEEPLSGLHAALLSGKFVVTAELGPPKGAKREVIERKAKLLGDWVDALNVTDNQTAVTRMCSLAACAILSGMGLEPVLQMTARDRNRLAIQSDILGAHALGVHNVLCLSGDHVSMGNHPGAKPVYDIDSIQMVGMVRRMRDEGRFLSGDEIKGERPRMFIGAASNPFAPPLEFRPLRLEKKVRAGAQFIQTQVVFDLQRFAEFMAEVRRLGLHKRAFLLPGVMPVKSAKVLKYMATQVPGVMVPRELIARMEGASDQKEEGIEIAVETVQALREEEGVSGVHLMAFMWEEVVPEIVERAALRREG